MKMTNNTRAGAMNRYAMGCESPESRGRVIARRRSHPSMANSHSSRICRRRGRCGAPRVSSTTPPLCFAPRNRRAISGTESRKCFAFHGAKRSMGSPMTRFQYFSLAYDYNIVKSFIKTQKQTALKLKTVRLDELHKVTELRLRHGNTRIGTSIVET